MNRNIDLVELEKYTKGYEIYDGNPEKQRGFAVGMMRQFYPDVKNYSDAKTRFFREDVSDQEVYNYAKGLSDGYKQTGEEVGKYINEPDKITDEERFKVLKTNAWLAYNDVVKNIPEADRNLAFALAYAEGSRSEIQDAYFEKLKNLSEDEYNRVLYVANLVKPQEKDSWLIKRLYNTVAEGIGDTGVGLSAWWKEQGVGATPAKIYDTVKNLDAIDENGNIKADKIESLNKELNYLANSHKYMTRGQYDETLNPENRLLYGASKQQEYTEDYILEQYNKAKEYKKAYDIVQDIRSLRAIDFDKKDALLPEVVENALTVGSDMLVRYVVPAVTTGALTRNPMAVKGVVGAIMFAEFKPAMYNSLRHEGNLSVEKANQLSNLSAIASVAANYIGYTKFVSALSPKSYLTNTAISEATAKGFFASAIKEVTKKAIADGGTELSSEYAELVVDFATKAYAEAFEGATYDMNKQWGIFKEEFIETSKVMPVLMFGASSIGGGISLNTARKQAGVNFNPKNLLKPSEAVEHQVKLQAGVAQLEKGVNDLETETRGKLSKADNAEWLEKYNKAKTEEERQALLDQRQDLSPEEKAQAKTALDNLEKIAQATDEYKQKLVSQALKKNEEEYANLAKEAESIDEFNEETETDAKFKIIENFLDKFDARDTTVFLNSIEDLEALGFSKESSKAIYENLNRKGFYIAENDKVYLLSSHFKNGVDALTTFVHERGHFFANKIKGSKEYTAILNRIISIIGENNLRSILPASYANDSADALAEEYLMRTVERVALEQTINPKEKGVWAIFKDKLKSWFGSTDEAGFAKLADKEIASYAKFIFQGSQVAQKTQESKEATKQNKNEWTASTPENNAKKVSGTWAIIDEKDLLTSTDKGYDDKLQPRNRSRKGSVEQTTEISTHLDSSRLLESNTTDQGSPIVDKRNMVISGNGRTIAIRQAYGAENPEKAQAYRETVLNKARSMGLEFDENIEKPILVRVVEDFGDISPEEFASRSNKSQVAGLSNAEEAISDARRILDARLLEIFMPSDRGEILASSNKDFVGAFLDLVGGREKYIDANGTIKYNLIPRIKSAVLAAMLNPEKRDIVERLLDNPKGWSSLINGLMSCSAQLAKLSGNADYDLSQELSTAVEMYVQIKTDGSNVESFLQQDDFTRSPISPEVEFLLRLFEANAKTSTGISGVLNTYYELSKNIDTTSQDIFGAENPSKAEILNKAYNKYSSSVETEPKATWKDDSPTSQEEAQVEKIISEATMPNQIYDIDEAYKFARENLKGEYTNKGGFKAILSRNSLDKMNSGKARAKTGNNELHALALSNVDKLFENAELLESEDARNNSEDVKSVHKFYAPILLGTKPYVIKITAKEIINPKTNKLYSIEGIDIQEESELSGQTNKNIRTVQNSDSMDSGQSVARENKNSSTLQQYPDSVKSFFEKIRKVKKKLLDNEHKKLYEEYNAGDETALEKAQKLVDSVASEQEYNTKVYHGTGASFYTIPQADTTYEENGEGNQAYGSGLYMAEKKGIAETYKENASEASEIFVNGKSLVSELKKAIQNGLDLKFEEFENIQRILRISIKESMSYDEIIKNLEGDTESLNSLRKIEDIFGKNPSISKKQGTLFNWRHNLKDEEVLQFDTPLGEQAEIFEKYKKAWDKDIQRLAKHYYGYDEAEYNDIKKKLEPKPEQTIRNIITSGQLLLEADGFREIMLKHGIRGVKYLDGTSRKKGEGTYNYVSFEGKSAVKLQEPFTFDDDFELIPLSERFNKSNPDIRWKDGELKKRVNKWAESDDNINNAVAKYLEQAKTSSGQYRIDPDEARKFVPEYDISNNAIFIPTGDKILNRAWKKALEESPKDKGVLLLTGNPASGKGTALGNGLDEINNAGVVLDSPLNAFSSVETRVRQSIEAGHTITIVQIYNDPITSWTNALNRGIKIGRFLPLKYFVRGAYEKSIGKVFDIENELKVKYSEKINTIYIDNSGNNAKIVSSEQAILWDYSISKKQLDEIKRITYGKIKEIIEGSTLGDDKKNPFTIITQGLLPSRGYAKSKDNTLSRFAKRLQGRIPQDFRQDNSGNAKGIRSERVGLSESTQEPKNLKDLLRQDRKENPVIWASIVLAKEIALGRNITQTKIDKLLPPAQFDGSKQKYAVERAKEIAQRAKATKANFTTQLDLAIRQAESDVYWQSEFVDNAQKEFSKGGQEYGFAKAKIQQFLKDLKAQELSKIAGYDANDFKTDYIEKIRLAMESEPQRTLPEEAKLADEEIDELGDIDESPDAEVSIDKTPATPQSIVDIIKNIRLDVIRKANAKDADQRTFQEQYRRTLINILTQASKELTFTVEREKILAKIDELKNKKYTIITIKDGVRAGDKIDNFTLRAEHIAKRIFNRGVRDTKNQLAQKLISLLKNIKNPKRTEIDSKRKMTGRSVERAKFIKDIIFANSEEIVALNEEISDKINNGISNMSNEEIASYILKQSDLARFGNLMSKTRGDIASAVEWVEKFLESETEKQFDKVKELDENAEIQRSKFIDAVDMSLSNYNFDSNFTKATKALLNTSTTFDAKLNILIGASSGKTREEAKALVDKITNDIYLATSQRDNEVFNHQNELVQAVEEIYGIDKYDAFKKILGTNANLQKFSVQGKPMSIQVALQRLSMAEQKQYAFNIYLHCIKYKKVDEEIENLSKEIDELRQKWQGIDTFPDERVADLNVIENLEKARATKAEKLAKQYAQGLRKALSEQDLKLLDYFREFYRKDRDSLSAVNELTTGLLIPESDPNYTPMTILRDGGLNEEVRVVAIVPKSMNARVSHSFDMNEGVGIIDIFNNRIMENAHYKAFSQLNLELSAIFSNARFQKAVREKFGKSTLTDFIKHYNDIMTTSLTSGLGLKAIDSLNGVFAVMALGFNLGSGFRQLPGGAGFANFIGTAKSVKYSADAFCSEGLSAMKEIWLSDTMQRRFQTGNNMALIETLNKVDENKFWAMYKRHSLIFNKLGDLLPVLIIGQGIYRSKLHAYKDSMSLEDAKKRAMTEMWSLAEMSLQSGATMNMSAWSRRGSSAGKTLSLFTSSPQLLVSKELEAYHRYKELKARHLANREDKALQKEFTEARKEFAKVAFRNHVFNQGGYALAAILWKALLGDDLDGEDVFWSLFVQMLAGPFGSLVVVGQLLNATFSNWNTSVAPVSGLGNLIRGSSELVGDIITLEAKDIPSDLHKLAKGVSPFYRDSSKAINNATDKKEGALW